ncbi:LacI family DNA-binding transcriptional regulator [Planctomonas psychrotolerans]|uniref:LacI family DNA-binding transcriptional regulator n=1 Tax=Planctomonas psychrotolerans TaxID=2528712 RepID=UPI0012397EED|nr:LacI family DNA-binding transcriptional regulator [Planctomonas psychrotolerans]
MDTETPSATVGRSRTKVRVADIAELAGVSPGTASKALNGRGQLSRDTRERVLAAARELGIRPTMLPRTGGGGRTYTVGVLTGESFGRFTIPVMLGAEDALGAGQISVLLCDGRGDRIREQHYLRTLLARRVDGIIVTGRGDDERPSIGSDLPIPVVYAMVQSENESDLSLMPDDNRAAEVAIDHLLSTGRRRIAHVTGPPHHIASRRRAAGVRTALERAGEPLVLGTVLHGEWSERWGREAANTLLRADEPFDGVFCGSDQIARGLVTGLREAGTRVPEEVGVVGVDNWDVMVEASRPPLTTVDLDLHRLGHLAATKLLRSIEGAPLASGVQFVPPRLVARQSTETVPRRA